MTPGPGTPREADPAAPGVCKPPRRLADSVADRAAAPDAAAGASSCHGQAGPGHGPPAAPARLRRPPRRIALAAWQGLPESAPGAGWASIVTVIELHCSELGIFNRDFRYAESDSMMNLNTSVPVRAVTRRTRRRSNSPGHALAAQLTPVPVTRSCNLLLPEDSDITVTTRPMPVRRSHESRPGPGSQLSIFELQLEAALAEWLCGHPGRGRGRAPGRPEPRSDSPTESLSSRHGPGRTVRPGRSRGGLAESADITVTRATQPGRRPTRMRLSAAKLYFGGPGRISDFWILTLTRSSPSPIYLQLFPDVTSGRWLQS